MLSTSVARSGLGVASWPTRLLVSTLFGFLVLLSWQRPVQAAPPAQSIDLGVTKTVTPGRVAPGGSITYTIAYTNSGVISATQVVLTDLLPSGVVNASFRVSGVTGSTPVQRLGTTYFFDIAELEGGQGGVITIQGILAGVVNADGTITGAPADGAQIANVATIGAAGGELEENFANNNSGAQSFTVDYPPRLLSITPVGASLTGAATVDFLVTFSEAVSGVGMSNFTLAQGGGLAGATITGVTGDGATRTVTVATGNGDGTLDLNLTDGAGIADLSAGQALVGLPFTGQSYTLDKTPPTVTINQAQGQADPTNSGPLLFQLVFSEPISPTTLTGADVTLVSTAPGTLVTTISELTPNNGTLYQAAVSGMNGSGVITASVAANGVSDLAGNGNLAATSTDASVAFDNAPPQVTAITRLDASPTSAPSARFLVTWSEVVTGVDASDFTLMTADLTGAGIGAVAGSGITRTVTVSTGMGLGSVQLNLVDDDSIRDSVDNPLGGVGAGNGNFSSGESYSVDRVPDLALVKSNNVSAITTLGSPWSWQWAIANNGSGPAIFAGGAVILQDDLPAAGANYAVPTVTPASGVSGSLNCAISSATLVCTADSGGATLDPGGGLDIAVSVTPAVTGTFTNPRSGGLCTVDPDGGVSESSESNNSCADAVTVFAPELTITKTNNVSGLLSLGDLFTWTITMTNSGDAPARFGLGALLLIDDLPDGGLLYGQPRLGNFNNVTNGSAILCGYNAAQTLGCIAAGLVEINPGGSFAVAIPVTPTAVGLAINPRIGGRCAVDPNNSIAEPDETDNNCVDSVLVTTPDLTLSKTNDVSGTTTLDDFWNWSLVLHNGGAGAATFAPGQSLLRDELPESALTYGAVQTATTGLSGSGLVGCAIDPAAVLRCTATGGPVTIGPGASLTVTFATTATTPGNFVNPRSGGSCAADPENRRIEADESNNSCTDGVTVTAADLVITKTHRVSGDLFVGDGFTWTLTVTNSGDGPARFAPGETVISDSLPISGALYGPPVVTAPLSDSLSAGLGCELVNNLLACRAGLSPLVIEAYTGTVSVAIPVTATTNLTLTNPIEGGGCAVDPDGVLAESNELNNQCSDQVRALTPGSIVITKTTRPAGVGGFGFTHTLTTTGVFTLADGQSQSFLRVKPGVYTITEAITGSLTLIGIRCTDDDSVGNVISGTLTINLAEGEQVGCTFTNSRQGQLAVVKQVVNQSGGQARPSDFTIQISGTNVTTPSFAAVAAPGLTVTLDAGSYSVTELDVAGYTPTYSTDCTGLLLPGEQRTCTITNTDIAPKLTLIQQVINDQGGSAGPDDFGLAVGGRPITSGLAITLTAGVDYVITQTGLSGYGFVTITGDLGCPTALGGVVNLLIGTSITCTVTNDDLGPSVTLNSAVVNDDGGDATPADFPLLLGDQPITSGIAVTVTANTPITFSQQTLSGYRLITITGAGCPTVLGQAVTVAEGEALVCTLVNDDIAPVVTLTKTVRNDNGGRAGPNDFGLTVGSRVVASGEPITVAANMPITLTEIGLSGYGFAGFTGDPRCPAMLGGTVLLNEGETLGCTLVNEDLPATLTLVKVVTNESSVDPNSFGLTVGGAPVASGQVVTVPIEIPLVINEVSRPGYGFVRLEGDPQCPAQPGGTVTLALGEKVTCTFVNEAQGVILSEAPSGLQVSEALATPALYTVTLRSQPVATVTVTILPDAELTVDKSQLLFTPATWATPQLVQVLAVDDDLTEGDHSGLIRHTVSSSDPNYAGPTVSFSGNGPDPDADPSTLHVAISDNDGIPPFVLGVNRNGEVPGAGFYRDEDIIIFDPATVSWQLLFDGSDVGLAGVDVDAFTFTADGAILLSVDRDFDLDGYGPVDDADVLAFIPITLGLTTTGTITGYLDGSAVGLDTDGEDIDAIVLDDEGRLLVSVTGAFNAPGATGGDEDLFWLEDGLWSLFFDGSAVGLTEASEDLIAAYLSEDSLYLSLSGIYTTTRQQVQSSTVGGPGDIQRCPLGEQELPITSCSLIRVFSGSEQGLGNRQVDGWFVGNPPVNAPILPGFNPQAPNEPANDDADDADELDGLEDPDGNAPTNQLHLPLITN